MCKKIKGHFKPKEHKPPIVNQQNVHVEGSPASQSQLLTTVYMSKVVPVDRVKVNPTKLFIGPAL